MCNHQHFQALAVSSCFPSCLAPFALCWLHICQGLICYSSMGLCFTAAWHHCWPLPGGAGDSSQWRMLGASCWPSATSKPLLHGAQARGSRLSSALLRENHSFPGGAGSSYCCVYNMPNVLLSSATRFLLCWMVDPAVKLLGYRNPTDRGWKQENSCPNSAGAEDLEMSPEIMQWVCGSLKLQFCLLLWAQNFLTGGCWVVLVCQPGLELSWISPLASSMQWCLSAHRRSHAQILLGHRWGEESPSLRDEHEIL